MSNNSLGVDIGGTNIELGLVDMDGKILKKASIPSVMDKKPQILVESVFTEAMKLAGDEAVRRIGVGIAGLIDHRQGIVRYSPNLKEWKDVPLKEILHDHFEVPVAVANDVNAIAWGEYKFGGYGTEHLFCFTLGTGVGGGIVSGGRLILGANDAAAEFGHTSFQGKAECSCGLAGCLEAYVGASSLVAAARRRSVMTSRLARLGHTGQLTPQVLAEAAAGGDKTALGIFNDAGQRIGRALGNVVQLLDPEVIVINGGISKAGEIILEPIRTSLQRYIMPLEGRKLRVVSSVLREEAGILGASALAEGLG